MADWWGYVLAALVGAGIVAAIEAARRGRAQRESENSQANLAAVKRERDTIVVKLRSIEQEAAELRARMADADSKRFEEAGRPAPSGLRPAITEVSAAASALARTAARLRELVIVGAGAQSGASSTVVVDEIGDLRNTLKSREDDIAVILGRLHTFETDWLREHTAFMDARARISELEARLSLLGANAGMQSGAEPISPPPQESEERRARSVRRA